MAALTALFACSPAGLLNSVSRIRGDSATLAKRGAAYGTNPRQRIDVWTPRTAGTKRPVVVFFYGGGWSAGERSEYGFAGRALAAEGFVAMVPDYRLVPNVRFPTFVEDGALAVKWARDHAAEYGGDPNRISVMGHSAGAYIGAMLALDRHFLNDVGVDPSVIRAAALLSGPYDFYPFTDARAHDAFAAWPKPADTQPISFARAGAPPMLLIHGTSDSIVQPGNSRRLAAALEKLGSPVELKLYPGKSHIDPIKSLSPLFRGSTPALGDSVAFLRKHVR